MTKMLAKVIEMDRTPPTSGMYDSALVAGQIQDRDDGNNVADRLFCETADVVASYFENDSGGVDYDCTRAIVNPDGMTATGNWNQTFSMGGSILWGVGTTIGSRIMDTFVSVTEARSRINSVVNGGVAIVQHRDHGYYTGWGDPDYKSVDVRALTNGSLRPLVLSINCMTGCYNYGSENFMMSWLAHDTGGAYAVLCPVNVSYSWHNDWMTHGFYSAMLPDYVSTQIQSTSPNWTNNLPQPVNFTPGSGHRLGQVLNFAKQYYLQNLPDQPGSFNGNTDTMQLFHCFGDPESFVRLHAPQDLVVTHPASVDNGTQLTLTAEVGALVSLYAPAPINFHQVKISDGSPMVFDVLVEELGDLFVTVSKYDRIPYEGVVGVRSSTEPLLYVNESSFVKQSWEREDLDSDTFVVKNLGIGTINYTITSSAGWVSCTPNTGTATGEEVNDITVNYTVAALAPGNYNATITIEDLVNGTKTISVSLLVRPEEVFPKRGTTPEGWIVPAGADDGWVVVNDVFVEGDFSMRSAPIYYGQSSTIQYSGRFEAGEISFQRKVSCSSYNRLQFFLDGELMDYWSGELEWDKEKYTIEAGVHTFRWTYCKGLVNEGGSDCAWIDDVVFTNSIPLDSYTVTFDLNGMGERTGGGELVQTVVDGQDAVVPGVDGTFGWAFSFWSRAFTNIQSNITVVAKYEKALYQVTFDLGGKATATGGGELIQTMGFGASAVAPTFIVNPGWTFTGWSSEFDNITSSLVVEALYLPVPTRSFTFEVLAGWNLMSVPAVFEETLPEMFKTSDDKQLYSGSIWCWNSQEQIYEASKERCPSMTAVWFYAETAGISRSYQISEGQTSVLTLAPGWNMIGPVKSCDCRQIDMCNVMGPIWGWDTEVYYDVSEALRGNEANILKSGTGYWLYSPEGGEIDLK